MVLAGEKITGGYGQQAVVNNVSFRIDKGEVLGIIGPNGSGKSTLLQLCTGALPLMGGDVWLSGRRLHTYKDKERARLLAVVAQQAYVYFSYTVREFVALGRYPHTRRWLSVFNEADEEAIAQAMEALDVDHYQDQPLQTLSGGERQRVYLARALAQRPDVILLDEPTNHLDISYQMKFLDALKTWSHTKGGAVGIIFHDLNLAALYCDRVLLLGEGERKACGRPEEVLTKERIQSHYGADVNVVSHPDIPKRQLLLSPNINSERKSGSPPQVWVEGNVAVIDLTVPFKVFSSQTLTHTWEKQLKIELPHEGLRAKAFGPLLIDRSFDWQPAAGVRIKHVAGDNGEKILLGAKLHDRRADVFAILFSHLRDAAVADWFMAITKKLTAFLHPESELNTMTIVCERKGAVHSTGNVKQTVAELQKLLRRLLQEQR